jgi:hypothetical protein
VALPLIGFDSLLVKMKPMCYVRCNGSSRGCRCARAFSTFAFGRKSLASLWTALTFFITNATLAATSAIGIAARYPGDKNIASDPAVIFADDFESYTSPSQLTNKWDDAYQLRYTRIATETGHIFAGRKALEFSLPIRTTEVENALTKRLSPGQDRVFFRAYTNLMRDTRYAGPITTV